MCENSAGGPLGGHTLKKYLKIKFILHATHVASINTLALVSGKTRSQVMRDAIEYYTRHIGHIDLSCPWCDTVLIRDEGATSCNHARETRTGNNGVTSLRCAKCNRVVHLMD